MVSIDTPLFIICKHIPRQSDIDKIVRNIETCVIHSLELPIQAQDLVKAYETSTHFFDIYQYITDGKLPSSSKAQNCIRAEALKYVVINNFLFRIDTQKDKNIDKGNLFLLVIPEKYEPSQLESLPLSSLAANYSGPPQVNYGTEQPLVAIIPRAITTPVGEIQPTDTYRQIIPGMNECLYPTLTADGSLSTPASDDCSTLHKQITSKLDKYLQEAAEKCEAEDNYFDGQHTSTNTSTPQREANYLEDKNDISINNASNKTILESNEQDTG